MNRLLDVLVRAGYPHRKSACRKSLLYMTALASKHTRAEEEFEAHDIFQRRPKKT